MAKNDGGPAFARRDGVRHTGQEGMSLRDWFAGKVIQGIMATNPVDSTDLGKENLAKVLTQHSYMIADAMLAERKKKPDA